MWEFRRFGSRLPILAGILAFSSPSTTPAQTPLDGLAVGHFLSGGLPGGVIFVDNAASSSTLLGGSISCLEVNSLAIDPYDQTRLLVGGITVAGSACSSASMISQITLSGTMATGSTLLATLPTGSSVSDLVFDDDGNVFASSGTSVLLVDLETGTSTLILTTPTPTANALAYDPVGNHLYLGVTTGMVFHVDPRSGTPTPVNAVSTGTVTGSGTISGLTLSEDYGTLYACTFGTGLPGGPSGPTWIVQMPTDPGSWPVPPAPLDVTMPIGSTSLNDIEVHGTKMYTGSSTGTTDAIHEIDLSTGPPHPAVLLAYYPQGIPIGVHSQLVVNEFRDDLSVFPRRPVAGTTVAFRIAVGGPPGDSVCVAVVGFDPDGAGPAPFQSAPIELGAGTFGGVGGSFALPPIPVSLGPEASGVHVVLGFARVDALTGTLATVDLSAATIEIQ